MTPFLVFSVHNILKMCTLQEVMMIHRDTLPIKATRQIADRTVASIARSRNGTSITAEETIAAVVSGGSVSCGFVSARIRVHTALYTPPSFLTRILENLPDHCPLYTHLLSNSPSILAVSVIT